MAIAGQRTERYVHISSRIKYRVANSTIAPTESKSKTAVPAVASLDAFPALGSTRTTTTELPSHPRDIKTTDDPPKKEKRRQGKRRDREHRLDGLIRGYIGAEYECPLGHRFLSCGDGRICKIGHKGHPKVYDISQHDNF